MITSSPYCSNAVGDQCREGQHRQARTQVPKMQNIFQGNKTRDPHPALDDYEIIIVQPQPRT